MTSTRLERRAAIRTSRAAQFERMVEIREFEDRLNDLFAEGLIHGTTHVCLGQEALAVAVGASARNDDVVAATYRGHGIALALGLRPDAILAEILGKAAGCTGGVGGSMHLCARDVGLLPTSAIVGAGLPFAVGAAIAFQNRDEDRVAIAIFGDGASNIGAFHEALNMAAVARLPVVFICDNNLYGEYSRINLTTAVEDIHLRAISYGIPGEVVDGMDLCATIDAVSAALDRARSGRGPTLLEAKTYRYGGHSRADQATYRPEGELDLWRERDPIRLVRQAMLASGALTETEMVQACDRVQHDLDETIARVRNEPDPSPRAMFDHVWSAAQ